MRDDNVYRCVTTPSGRKKYIPFGLRYDENYLPDGIWYVRHRDGSYGTASVQWLQHMYKVGDSAIKDLPKLCGMFDYAEYVLNHPEFREMTERPVSISDVVNKAVSLIFDKNNKEGKTSWISVDERLPAFGDDVLVRGDDIEDVWFSHIADRDKVKCDEHGFADIHPTRIKYWTEVPR